MNTGLADQLAFAEEAHRVAEELASARLTECAGLKNRLKAAEKAQAAAEQRAADGELVRRKLHNAILVRAVPVRSMARKMLWPLFSTHDQSVQPRKPRMDNRPELHITVLVHALPGMQIYALQMIRFGVSYVNRNESCAGCTSKRKCNVCLLLHFKVQESESLSS